MRPGREQPHRLFNRVAQAEGSRIELQTPRLDLRNVEDIVQDILLSLHAVRHTYDPTRPFVPY